MKSSKRMGSFQLSAFCQTWIITIHRRVAVSCAESGQNCTDGLTINNELGTEALLQLSILHPDHHRTSCDGKRRQHPADCETCSQTPGQHFAEMAKIDRVADSGADSSGDEALVLVFGADFWQTSQLSPGEVGSRARIGEDAYRKEEGCGKPGPRHRVEFYLPPWAGQGADADPHDEPGGDQHAERRTLAGAPAMGSRVNHQPKQRDSRIDHADQPSQGLEKMHGVILQASPDGFVRAGCLRIAGRTNASEIGRASCR